MTYAWYSVWQTAGPSHSPFERCCCTSAQVFGEKSSSSSSPSSSAKKSSLRLCCLLTHSSKAVSCAGHADTHSLGSAATVIDVMRWMSLSSVLSMHSQASWQ